MVHGLLMDTLNMVVHSAGLICGYSKGALVAANFILFVTMIHSLLLFRGPLGFNFLTLVGCVQT